MNARRMCLLATAGAILLCIAAENDDFTKLVQKWQPRPDRSDLRLQVGRFIKSTVPENREYDLASGRKTIPYFKEYSLYMSAEGVRLSVTGQQTETKKLSLDDQYRIDDLIEPARRKTNPPPYLTLSFNDAEKLRPLFHRFDEWTAISLQEQLSPNLRKPLGKVGKYSFFFCTPEFLEISNNERDVHDPDAPSIIPRQEVAYFHALLATLPELKSELNNRLQAERKIETERKLEEAARTEKEKREQEARERKRQADEEKLKVLLK